MLRLINRLAQTFPASGEDIIEWSREQMANYKVPRTITIVDTLPLNATGKVMKDVLRQQASEARS